MTNEFIYSMLAVGAFTGVLMAVAQWAVYSDKYKKYRIRTPEVQTIPTGRKIINVGLNMIFSVLIFVAALYFFGDMLVDFKTHARAVTVFGEVLASLLLYDFMYYFMHRTFHHPKLMKYIHGIHHRGRFPTAFESIFLHPAENFGGLFLLMLATSLIGPVSALSFVLIVGFHSVINVLVHVNMVFPHPVFRLTNFWSTKHDFHHGKHLNRNFSSIFPFWDQMFGTYQ